MNIYSKILAATLPLVYFFFFATVGITYYFSTTALNQLAKTWLQTRLHEAMEAVSEQEAMLHKYGLEAVNASIANAKADAAKELASIMVGTSGRIFAVDTRGVVVLHPDPAKIGSDVSGQSWFQGLKPGSGQLTYMARDGETLAVYDYFKPWKMFVLATDSLQELYGAANRIKPTLIVLGISISVVLALALMLLARRLTAPLSVLTDGAERIGKGDLEGRIAISSRDEFGRLAKVFNQMAAQLKETLTAMQYREEHFRSLIENASDIVMIIDASGAITYASPSIYRILGYDQGALNNTAIFDLVHPEDRTHAQRLFNRRLRTHGAAPSIEIRVLHHDGTWRVLEASSKNLLDHPAVAGIVVNSRDISKRKLAEEALQKSHQRLEQRVAERTRELFEANKQLRQEIEERKQMSREKDEIQAQLLQFQKMEAIGTLAGGIAHDFNNLLMGIQGNISMLQIDATLNSDHRKKIEVIQDCIRSGATLARQLLGFARLGKYEVKQANINDLVEKSVRMFGRTKKELRVNAAYQDRVWTVAVDSGQIEQVLLNLFINAWHAMPHGGQLSIETTNVAVDSDLAKKHQANAGRYVSISVTDTGTGMDPGILERIFDPFFTTKDIKRGTGLGLASAYGIVRNHGGFIAVQSQKGKGSTFNVYLPAVEAQVIKPKAIAQEPIRGDETLLLVDDEPMIAQVGQSMLEALGYAVFVAGSGPEAIECYQRHGDKIQLVILDMIMPEMSGGQTYDRLKTLDPNIKVLLASGYSINWQATQILDRGCNGFIQKPFDLMALSHALRKILDAG
jgi:PAS domain S-box-containing protein